MKFLDIKNEDDLKQFCIDNRDNFTIEITGCSVTRANGYANFNVLLTIGDYTDTITITNADFRNLNIWYFMVKKLKNNISYYIRSDSELKSAIKESLEKKIKEYKKSEAFREAHEEFIIYQMTNIIEYEFESRNIFFSCLEKAFELSIEPKIKELREINKEKYSEEFLQKSFNKLINRIYIKEILE